MLNSELNILEAQNDEILHEINHCQMNLEKYDNKLQLLDNMTQLATQSLEIYFQTVRNIFQRKKKNKTAYLKYRIFCN